METKDSGTAIPDTTQMKINADLAKRAVVTIEDVPWVDSPQPGVQRRMLERDGDEVARATSVVRYAPKSYFPSHVHTGGEEFIVLEGVFSDEHGDYGTGMYVRNPVGSTHEPFTEDGCTILVKLWQMDPEDQKHVRIDTNTAAWLPGPAKGLRVMPLHTRGKEEIALAKWDPGSRFHRHTHPGGEEILVLEGTLEDEHGRYPKGTWLRNPPGSTHAPFSGEGCVIYVKTGHLDPGQSRF